MTEEHDKSNTEISFDEVSSERFREIILDLEVAKKKEIEQRKFSESLVNGLKALTSSDNTSAIFLNLLETLKDVLAFDVAIVLQKQSDELYKAIIATHEIFYDTEWKQGKVFQRLMKGKPLVLGSIEKSVEWEDKHESLKAFASSVLYIPIIGEYQHVILCFLKQDSIFNNGHKELGVKLIPLVTSAVQNTEKSQLIREKSKATQALFKSLPVGVLTLENEGKINPDYSKICEEIFGTKDISTKSISELFLDKSTLSGEERSLVISTINSSIDEDEINFELNSDKLAHDLEIEVNGETKYIDLTWSYVTNDNHLIAAIILVIKDVTIFRQLEENEKLKSQELEIFGQLLSSSPEFLVPAFEDFKKMLSNLNELRITKDDESQKCALRILHTIKGNARVFNFNLLSSTVHDIETRLSQEGVDLEQEFDKSLKEITDTFQLYLETAKKLRIIDDGKESDSNFLNLKLDKETTKTIEEKYALARQGKITLDETTCKLIDCIQSARSQYLPKIIELNIISLNEIAGKLNKQEPKVEFGGEIAPIFSEYKTTIADVFGHLLRNSIDHGIEDTDARVACGKDPQGLISITTKFENEKAIISYEDDGKGLNIHKIKEKAVAAKLIEPSIGSTQQIAELIFSPEFSSRDEVTITSGRGVGMDAVACFLQDIGSDIKIVLKDEVSGDGYCKFYFDISLPKEIFYFSLLKI